MKAVKFYGVGDVRTVDTEAATPGGGQALIRVLYGGICGSDLHIYRKGMFVERLEETMGHEFVGRVCSAPAESGLSEGDLVVGDPRVPCGHCRACLEGDSHRCASLGFIGEVRPGCFAEYLALEPEKLIVLPKDTDLKQAALCEPLAVAIHACKEIMRADPQRVLVMGAGPIGLLIACLLKAQYRVAQVTVADLDEFRLSFRHLRNVACSRRQLSGIQRAEALREQRLFLFRFAGGRPAGRREKAASGLAGDPRAARRSGGSGVSAVDGSGKDGFENLIGFSNLIGTFAPWIGRVPQMV